MYSRSFLSPYSYSPYSSYSSCYQPCRRLCQPCCRSFYPYCRYPCASPCASFCPQRCSRVEYIPIEKSYIEYVPQVQTQYVPCERRCTDYYQIQHDIDYVPVPRIEKYYEYVPQERYCTAYDYQPMHRSTVLPGRQSFDDIQYNNNRYSTHQFGNSTHYNTNDYVKNQQRLSDSDVNYKKGYYDNNIYAKNSDSDGNRDSDGEHKKKKKNKKKKSK